jgi:hypothetical protein
MAEQGPADKIPLTVQLSPDLARRLKAASEAQKRSPAEVVAELLDRHLPRPSAQKGRIPYA